MDNLMLSTEISGHPVAETAMSVPERVQTASSGGSGFIGFALVIIIIILAILTITLIMIEMRQEKLRKIIRLMAKRLECIEKELALFEKQETDAGIHFSEEQKVKTDSVTTQAEPAEPSKPSSDPVEDTIQDPAGREESSTGIPVTKSDDLRTETTEKSYPVTGLKVNSESHYNRNNPVSFDEIPAEDAVLILRSDRTIIPDSRHFDTFNNASYFTSHDFTMVFDFQDKAGYPIEMRHSLRCLKVAEPAVVIKTQNGYLLDKKGILIAEER